MKHFEQDFYDEDYFKPKKESKKSTFTMPYTWEVEQKEAYKIADQLITLFKPKSVFDVGCGKGFLLKAFKHRGVEKIRGIDISSWVIENADLQVKQYLRVGDIRDGFLGIFDNFVYQIEKYELITCFSTLEHIEEECLKDG